MRKRVAVVLAGSLGVVGLVGCDDSTDTSTSGAGDRVERAIDRAGDAISRGAERTGQVLDEAADKTADAVERGIEEASELGRRAGDKASEWLEANVSDAAQIKETLAEAAEAALTRDRLNDLVARLAEADRMRIGQVGDAMTAELSQRLDRLRSQWQGKFNVPFDVDDDESAIFQNARITTAAQGEKKQAKVVLPSFRGMPELSLSLVNEGSSLDAWRIDAPDSLTAETLPGRLTAEIRKLEEFSAAWPDDATEARRLAVHHVLAPLSTGHAAAPATAQR